VLSKASSPQARIGLPEGLQGRTPEPSMHVTQLTMIRSLAEVCLEFSPLRLLLAMLMPNARRTMMYRTTFLKAAALEAPAARRLRPSQLLFPAAVRHIPRPTLTPRMSTSASVCCPLKDYVMTSCIDSGH
jgi:hypothetical protein